MPQSQRKERPLARVSFVAGATTPGASFYCSRFSNGSRLVVDGTKRARDLNLYDEPPHPWLPFQGGGGGAGGSAGLVA